jgi:hypothetical protein
MALAPGHRPSQVRVTVPVVTFFTGRGKLSVPVSERHESESHTVTDASSPASRLTGSESNFKLKP